MKYEPARPVCSTKTAQVGTLCTWTMLKEDSHETRRENENLKSDLGKIKHINVLTSEKQMKSNWTETKRVNEIQNTTPSSRNSLS